MNFSKIAALSLLLIVSVLLIGYSLCKGQEWPGLWLNLATELLGAVVTFLIFDYYIGNREKIQEAKTSLIRDLHSEDRELRMYAFTRLVEDDLLSDIKVNGVNLDGLVLEKQKMDNVDFSLSSLIGANIDNCEFYNCRFNKSKLKGSVLTNTTFKKCSFDRADFSGSHFTNNKVINSTFFQSILNTVIIEKSEFNKTDLNQCQVLNTDLSKAIIR